ncbi:MAG: chorismate-binding protein [Halodesulfovibrio sp.]
MPCVFSASVSSRALPALLHHLARHYQADLLLCGPLAPAAAPRTERSIAGIGPVRELELQANTQREQLHDFCFSPCKTAVPGTIGYLSYSHGLARYGIPNDTPESKPEGLPDELPEGLFRQYAILLIISPAQEAPGSQDSVHNAVGTHVLECHTAEVLPDSLCGLPPTELLDELKALCSDETSVDPLPAHIPPLTREALSGRLRQSLDQKAYVRGVERVLEHIRDGDTYQLNLSTRFDADLSGTAFDPLSFFMHMWEQHPAPFYAWLSHGSKRIISTSPERFLCVRDGQVLSQPIKGTLEFETCTEGMEEALTASPKESAELSMIVDLIRNDIATRCEYGSVQVSTHKATFTVDRLIQMYSDVRGTLRAGSTCLDLLLDAFPGGSVTGCPKQRTMRIIEAEEPHSRGLYCGSIIFIEDPANMDSSIAIRTGWYDIYTKALCFFSGSGIVLDSNPESEYRETLAKAGKFLRALAS